MKGTSATAQLDISETAERQPFSLQVDKEKQRPQIYWDIVRFMQNITLKEKKLAILKELPKAWTKGTKGDFVIAHIFITNIMTTMLIKVVQLEKKIYSDQSTPLMHTKLPYPYNLSDSFIYDSSTVSDCLPNVTSNT